MATLPKSFPKPKAKSRAGASKSLSASKAKAHLLELLDTVDRTREGLIITKRGRPVAKLVPVDREPARNIFGCMKGTFRVTGDVVGPEPDAWEALR